HKLSKPGSYPRTSRLERATTICCACATINPTAADPTGKDLQAERFKRRDGAGYTRQSCRGGPHARQSMALLPGNVEILRIEPRPRTARAAPATRSVTETVIRVLRPGLEGVPFGAEPQPRPARLQRRAVELEEEIPAAQVAFLNASLRSCFVRL